MTKLRGRYIALVVGVVLLAATVVRLNAWYTAPKVLVQLPNDFAMGVAYAPDGQTIAFGTLDQGAQLWRIADGKLVRTFGQGRVNDVTFTPDGQLLVTSGGDEFAAVQVWRVQDGRLLQTLDQS